MVEAFSQFWAVDVYLDESGFPWGGHVSLCFTDAFCDFNPFRIEWDCVFRQTSSVKITEQLWLSESCNPVWIGINCGLLLLHKASSHLFWPLSTSVSEMCWCFARWAFFMDCFANFLSKISVGSTANFPSEHCFYIFFVAYIFNFYVILFESDSQDTIDFYFPLLFYTFYSKNPKKKVSSKKE